MSGFSETIKLILTYFQFSDIRIESNKKELSFIKEWLYKPVWKMPESIQSYTSYLLKQAKLGKKMVKEVKMGTRTKVEKRVLDDFEKLSKEHRKEVLDFVSYLKAKEELSATKAILEDDDFLKSIMKGDEDFNRGRFKKWSEVKEDV